MDKAKPAERKKYPSTKQARANFSLEDTVAGLNSFMARRHKLKTPEDGSAVVQIAGQPRKAEPTIDSIKSLSKSRRR